MDFTDFTIAMSLLREPFASNEAVGRRVGITGTSVKARLDSLRRDVGFRGLRLLPSPATLGRVARAHFFPASDRSRAFLERVLDAQDVVWIVAHHEATISVLTFEEPAGQPDDLRQAVGADPVLSVDLQLTPNPRPPVLSPLDWRILRAVLPDPRRTATEVADATGLSRRTVAQRRQALVDNGAAYAAPLWEEARSTGGLLYHMIVLGLAANQAAAMIPYGMPYAVMTSRQGAAFVAWAPSASNALDAQKAAEKAGATALLNIPVSNLFAQERIEAWIDEQIARWRR